MFINNFWTKQPFLRILLVSIYTVSISICVLAPTIIYYSSLHEGLKQLLYTSEEILKIFAEEATFPLLVKSDQDADVIVRRAARFPDIQCLRIITPEEAILATSCPQMLEGPSETLVTAVTAAATAPYDTASEHQQNENIGRVELIVSLQRAYHTSTATALDAAVPIVVATMLMSLVLVRVSGSMLSPLAEIVGFLRAEAPTQTTPPRISLHAPAEVHVIRDALQSMRERIATDTERLREYAEELQKMVDQRTVQLTEALSEAEDASRAKTLFIANVSHELRTPLQAIILHSSILNITRCTPETMRKLEESRQSITQASAQLLLLIEQLLDASKIHATGSVNLNYSHFEMQPFIAEIVTTIAPTLCGENRLSVHLDDALTQVYCDRMRLFQIASNLIRNADKFTRGGTISVSFERASNANWWRMRVADTGIGIKRQDIERIFEPFFQGGPRAGAVDEGIGVGLWITRNIVTALGGSIYVDSKIGSGTTMDVLVPDAPLLLRDSDALFNVEEEAVSAPMHPQPPLRVLFAEDEAIIRRALVMFLHDAGFVVDVCEDGARATQLLEQQGEVYDMLVLDERMPHCRGSQILAMVRDQMDMQIPVILLTGNESDVLQRECALRQATLIHKPIKPDTLIAEIRAHVARSKSA
jgi:signal transduction histidine kinase/ActR/RegA family two-component response regulator